MAASESLEECLRAVPVERLGQVCLDDHLLELSLVFTDWQAVSPFLGLSETEEEEIEKQHSARRQRINVLRTWQAKLGTGGTYSSQDHKRAARPLLPLELPVSC